MLYGTLSTHLPDVYVVGTQYCAEKGRRAHYHEERSVLPFKEVTNLTSFRQNAAVQYP